MNKPDSNVYFADCTTITGVDMGVVKIGVSHAVEKRVEAVAVNQPFKMQLICHTPGDLFLEYFVHMWLWKDRVSGEFFRRSDEMDRIIAGIQKNGRLPFAVTRTGEQINFCENDCPAYMARMNISFKDIEVHAGIGTQHYRKLLETHKSGNRRFLAALAVASVKMGNRINWVRDFRPPPLSGANSNISIKRPVKEAAE